MDIDRLLDAATDSSVRFRQRQLSAMTSPPMAVSVLVEFRYRENIHQELTGCCWYQPRLRSSRKYYHLRCDVLGIAPNTLPGYAHVSVSYRGIKSTTYILPPGLREHWKMLLCISAVALD